MLATSRRLRFEAVESRNLLSGNGLGGLLGSLGGALGAGLNVSGHTPLGDISSQTQVAAQVSSNGVTVGAHATANTLGLVSLNIAATANANVNTSAVTSLVDTVLSDVFGTLNSVTGSLGSIGGSASGSGSVSGSM